MSHFAPCLFTMSVIAIVFHRPQLDMSELEKADGALSCGSILF